MNRMLTSLLGLFVSLCAVAFPNLLAAQTGNSSSISGTVVDGSGGVVAGATVTIRNPVSGLNRSAATDSAGNFTFPNVPFNPYHLSVAAEGFAPYAQDVEVRSSVPAEVKIALKVAGTSSTVTVEGGGDLVENDPTFHTDVDRGLFDKLPLESASSSVSSLVTLASPGVAADSNGLFHGLGDHAENSFSVDGQPITDQQSKVFSNQIPLDAIQSMEVISGAPPAEYGDKTSLVIDVTTRSGQGVTTPHGSIHAAYGSFGTGNTGFDLAYGRAKWGNFISASGMTSGRFLDPPEFSVMHDKGNEENIFDRVDYQLTAADSIHLNLGYTRSWFQNPNSFDNEFASPWNGVVVNAGGLGPDGTPVGPTDQRSKIGTFNIAPTWNHLIGSTAVFSLGLFVRRDAYDYYPSDNPFADLGPTDLQQETLAQYRTLANAGIRSSLSYVRGAHNVKAGITYDETFLTERDTFGIVDPSLLPSLGCPDPAVPQCAVLLPYDLTRGGGRFTFHGHTDVKQLSLYVQDTIREGNWAFNLGMRGDIYNGLATATQAEPRLGIAYNIKPTGTVLRVSYARTLETPFNENLVLSSTGCLDPVVAAIFSATGEGCASGTATPLAPGFRNEFHAGLQQAFGRYLVVDGEYIWKYTHNAYDFSILGATPVTFPIEWNNSKIPGYAIRASVPDYHGFTALVVMSSVAARFFTPQIGGVGSVPIAPGSFSPFRIDHDEKFNLTAHLQYQPWKKGPWAGFNWRYDNGLVAGPVPCAGGNCANGPAGTGGFGGADIVDVSGISPDQQYEAGLFCGQVYAAPPSAANPTGTPVRSGSLGTSANPLGLNLCPASQYGSKYLRIPAPDAENDDHNPPRVSPRSLFDLSVGEDNLFRGDRHKWSLRFTAINLLNKVAVYNFLSTFSGTHQVTPRSLTAEAGFHF